MKEEVQFKLKMPVEVKAWIAEQAERNLRSQGAEVVACLQERMERTKQKEQA